MSDWEGTAAGQVTSSILGRLTSVPPREVWPHEAHDFTPWLLQNVDVLSDVIGMDLVLESAEHPVGGFSLDLIGYDESTGEVVIVENQLEQSDHMHLGQIITYAAGTEPTTIVWVTTGFRSEHRAAIDWLNQRTDERTRVFGVVIHVVRIGNSQYAPNFELVAQPNDWEKQVKQASAVTTTSQSSKALIYGDFWTFVLDRIRSEHPSWTRGRTSNQSFCDTGTGTAGVVISMAWVGGVLRAQVYLGTPDADLNLARFEGLYANREAFEAALGEPAEWDEMPGRKACRIALLGPFTDVADRTTWPACASWLIQKQVALRGALAATSHAL